MKRKISAFGAAAAALAAPAVVWAQSAGGHFDLTDRFGLKDLAGAGLALIVVLALLLLALKALQRLGRFKGPRGRESVFELRGLHHLDNRKYLAAVAVDGRLMVIGVTPDRLTPLGQWPLSAEAPEAGSGPESVFRLPEDDAPPDISVVGTEEPPGTGEPLR